jgi:heme/copper-type cytochrome/quinol oxidase subunit 2
MWYREAAGHVNGRVLGADLGLAGNRCHRTIKAVRTALLTLALLALGAGAQDQGPTAKPFAVTVRRFAFDPPRIEVNQDDLVKIELHTDDIAHSLTIDDYRIAKRVGPGHPVTFEFRADRAGTFPYYCNLQIEDGCRRMRGELVVRPRH